MGGSDDDGCKFRTNCNKFSWSWNSCYVYALIPALIAVATGTTALLSCAFGANNKIEGKKAFAQSFL